MGLFDAPDFGPSIRAQNKALKSANKNTKKAEGYIDTSVTQAQPYLQQGTELFDPILQGQMGAYDMYLNSLGLNGPEGNQAAIGAYQTSPGFGFALDQANQNVLRNQAALGGVASGQSMIDLSERARQLQNLDYGNWQNRLQGLDPMRGATAKAETLGNLAGLFTNAGANKAQTRMQGSGQMIGASNALAGTLGQQALANQQADMMPIQLGLGLLSGISGFYGA